MNFLISKDGNYILLGNKIASIKENKSFKIKDLGINEVIDIFKNQSVKLIEKDITKINEVNSIIRGLGNILSEELDGEESKTFLIELELKLNNNLITENVGDVGILMEGVWGWIKDKAGKVWGGIKKGTKFVAKKVWNGVKWVGGKMMEGLTWLWKKGLPWFFDHLREFVYSPIGIGIEIALQATGIGEIPILVVFGALLLWEIKELIEKGPSFWRIANVLFAALGCLPAGAALVRGSKATIKAVESAKGLKGASRAFFEKAINMVSKSIGGILSVMKRGLTWVAGIFGKGAVRWTERVLGSAERTILGASESLAKKVGTKRGAMALSKGFRAFIVWSGVNWGLHQFLKTETGKRVALSVMEFFGAAPQGASTGQQQINPNDLLTEQNIKMALEKYNPQLSPFNTFEVVQDKSTGQTSHFVINGKSYVIDMSKPGCVLVPKENTSTLNTDNKTTPITQPSTNTNQPNIQPNDDIYKQPNYQGGGWNF